jgi:predicted transcriptional regulator
MKLILILLILIIQNSIFSQQIDTIFYNNNWNIVKGQESAAFYRIKEPLNDSVSIINDYYILTKKLYCQGEVTNEFNSGRWTFYDEKGEVIKDYKYTNNGTSKHWYKFDENSLKPNENGFYMTTNVTPNYVGGMDCFYEFVAKNFVIPKKAQTNNIQSFKVSYQLNINEEGKIVKIWDQNKGVTILNEDFNSRDLSEKTITKLKKKINRKMKKLLSKKTVWIPATVKDNPVKSAKYISITY